MASQFKAMARQLEEIPRSRRRQDQRSRSERAAPPAWNRPATAVECALHQLAPYIGRLKSTIARDLVQAYSKRGDLILDPYCGSGTIPLEALLLDRRVFASDINPYAATLTMAKILPPPSVETALAHADALLIRAAQENVPDLRSIPQWVRMYFHPRTLKELIALARICTRERQYFVLACLLGILHHQRPGFLSYPSSHLVPYLRDRKFPRSEFPDLYDYRPVRPRLLSKIQRALRRGIPIGTDARFVRKSVERLRPTFEFDAMITSPPYMNALDYVRDNRLRLWLLGENRTSQRDENAQRSRSTFLHQMKVIAKVNDRNLIRGGHCVLIVGESVTRSTQMHPAQAVLEIFEEFAPTLSVEDVIVDKIPDVRRARRNCHGVKREKIIVFKKRG